MRHLKIMCVWFCMTAMVFAFPAIGSAADWTLQNPLPTANDLRGLWGSSDSDVFAVGGDGTILHYNGSTWSEMASGTTEYLNDVWGSSGSDVFAVGRGGTILHYDGSVWSEMTSGTTDWLNGVWGSSGSDVFAVGGPTILHYDGSAWSEMSYGGAGSEMTYEGVYARFNDVWGSSGSSVFAVGDYGTIFHYDGSVWSEMSYAETISYGDVWGSSGSDVYVVGNFSGSLMGYKMYTIRHYDGSAWSTMISGSSNCDGIHECDISGYGYDWLSGVWGSSGSSVFAVGSPGAILRYDGSVWSEMTSGTTEPIRAVWDSSGSDVFAVGDNGTILKYDNPTSTPVNGTVPVYRFYSEQLKKHFFTGDTNEKDTIIAAFPVDVWRYEGIAWYVFPDYQNGTLPVYRFYSEQLQSHFFTTDQNEKNTIIATFTADVWRYEGVAWYVYPDFQPDSLAVYRFYSELLKVHFYTMDENEKDTIIATFPVDVWRYEGIAYYAYP